MQQPRPGQAWSPTRHVRPLTSLALILAATVLLLPSIFVNWARTQIYDSDTFADNAVAALEDDAVRGALTRELVNELIRVGPAETLSIRPLVEFVTATVVDTQAFVEIYRNAVEEMHRGLFEGGAGNGPVALTLVDAIIVVVAFIEQAYPEVAQQLPPNLNTAFVELRDRDWAVRVIAFGEDSDYLSALLPIAVVALYGAAMWLAPNRRQAIVAIGISCVAAALIMVIARDFGRDLVLDEAGFVDQGATRAVWDVYTRPLLGWSTLLGVVGVLLAVGATGAHQRVDPLRQFEFLRRSVAFTPSSQLGKVLRATLFVAAGLLIISYRDQTLEALILSAAAYLLYYGLTELIWLAGPGSEVPTQLPRRPRTAVSGRMALRAGAFTALLVAAVGGAVITSQAIETVGGPAIAAPHVGACNGSEALCDRPLNEVAFLGTHNSMAASSERGWFFATHQYGIPEQLEAGVRMLLIDTWYGYDTGKGVRTANRDLIAENLPPDQNSEEVLAAAQRLTSFIGVAPEGVPAGTYLCHGFCELGATPLTEALIGINGFLDRNPGEVMIILIQDHITPEDTARAFISSGLIRRVYHHDDGGELPTLREMIERDQRVVVYTEGTNTGIDWYRNAYDFVQDTSFGAKTPEELSCAPFRGSGDNPLLAMNHWLSEPFPALRTASQINSFDFIYNRALDCLDRRRQMVNMVIVNFYDIGDAALAVDVLNGVAEPPQEAPETGIR